MLGVAVIGTGRWGKNHARVYKELMSEGIIDNLKICDTDEQCAKQIGETLEIQYTTNSHELIEDDDITAVTIATPSMTHYQIAKEFIEAGKDVLIEKPMTMNIDEARNLVDIAAECNRMLMVGHIFRYHPALCELKRRIDAGELGEILNLIGRRLYFGVPRSDMGVIYALGIHELDSFCHLLSVHYPKGLIAATSRSYQQSTEETAIIVMDFNHAKGYAVESWLLAPYGKVRDLVVVGTKASARIDYLVPHELHMFDNSIVTEGGIPVAIEGKGTRTISLPHSEPLKEELKHFVFCVVSRQSPLSDGLVGLRAVVMAEAALGSSRIGSTVALS